ncbi:MAG: CapA family protein [Micromonosporaceae bacterium]|jgi:D-alanine-D-alanine ligase-like ATP-grasp enzyme/poly-gamma-glutamate capsule biosynthesis protein CapA/YwtB (metallophosphatase superfamily)
MTAVIPPPKTWSPPGPVGRLDVMLVGDTTFGENYQEERASRGRENVLETHGYDHGFEQLDGLLEQADLVVANLETPLTRRRSSPFADIREFLHYSDPDLAPKHLIAHGIRAVTLANNHTHDFGEAGLLDTLQALEGSGLIVVGAGHNEHDAHEPLRVRAEIANPLGADSPFGMTLFNAFRAGRHFEHELRVFATADRPGVANLRTADLPRRIERLRAERPDEFVVVVLHWLRDYQWRSDRQVQAARELTAAGADLVVGHGSHMLQEIEKIGGRWVVHGLGNFIFNSAGRYRRLGVPPYSLVARITVSPSRVLLRLYPIVTDNRRTGYQPRPVTTAELNEIWELLLARTNAPAEFRREFDLVPAPPYPHLAVVIGHRGDRSGAALRPRPRPQPRPEDAHLRPRPRPEVAAPVSDVPAAADAAVPAGPAQRRSGRRPRNAALLAAELERRGIAVTWLDSNAMVAEADGVQLGYGFGVTHATGRAGVAVTHNRNFMRRLLVSAGLDVPRGRTFDGESGLEDAAVYARQLGEVVLCQPDRRSVRSVYVDARDAGAFEAAWAAVGGGGEAQVLVEERFPGTAARFLVVGGRWVAVAGYSGEAAARRSRTDELVGAVDPSFGDLAVRAALAIPGLDVAEVTIAATELSRPARSGRAVVWGVEPRPALADYAGGATGTGTGTGPGPATVDPVAAAIVDLHLGITPPVRTTGRPRRRVRTGTGLDDPVPSWPPVEREPLNRAFRVDSQLLALELKRRGATVTWLARRFFVAEIEGVRLGYRGAATHATGRFATNVASRKDLARQVLARAGLEVPEGRAFGRDEYEPAADYAAQLGDVVVKPVDGNKGRGVTVGVRDRNEFERAWRLAVRRSSVGVLVEQRFSGIELRCLVVGDRCVAVLRRLPPYVVGNGRDTIEQLIAAKNELRAQNPSLVGCDITMDAHRRDELRRQGYDLTSVLPDGLRVVLDHKGGISTGGESVDLTDDVHPSFKEVAVRATRAVPGLDVAGVDIITVDPRQPAAPGTYIVCEINHDPGIDIHHFPIHGSPRDVAGAMVDYHLSRLGIAARRRGLRFGGRRGS